MQHVGRPQPAAADGPGFRAALRVRAFRLVWLAETQSILGDQLARVALSVLVFDRTMSVPATAAIYATTYLPAILGGILLGRLGDHARRRAVMIGCDVLRALLFSAMAIPGLPLGAMTALLAVAVFLGPGFVAAEVSLLAAVMSRDQFRAGMGLRMISNQAAQVAGFAVGGALVAALDPRGTLLVNGATFLVSVLLVLRARTGVDARPQPGRHDELTAPVGRWLTRPVVALLALSALQGLFIVPEGLAIPLSAAIGSSTTDSGLLLAAIPLGGMLGAGLIVNVRRRARPLVGRVMAVACGLPLIGTAVTDDWRVVVALWFASGALAAYQVETMAALVRAVPDRARARLVGVGTAILLGAQGCGLVVFGFVASAASAAHAVALAGAIGAALALLIVLGPLGPIAPAGRHRSGNPTGVGEVTAAVTASDKVLEPAPAALL